jgi:hypothetical protein
MLKRKNNTWLAKDAVHVSRLKKVDSYSLCPDYAFEIYSENF